MYHKTCRSFGRKRPPSRVKAVSSRRQETADGIAKEFGVPAAYDDYQELVEDSDVDVVIVLSPAPKHPDVVRLPLLNPIGEYKANMAQ